MKTPEERYDDDLYHMVVEHGEDRDELDSRLKVVYADALSQRAFALTILHWKKHDLLPKDWKFEL